MGQCGTLGLTPKLYESAVCKCSDFRFILRGTYHDILLISAEIFNVLVDPFDRSSYVKQSERGVVQCPGLWVYFPH